MNGAKISDNDKELATQTILARIAIASLTEPQFSENSVFDNPKKLNSYMDAAMTDFKPYNEYSPQEITKILNTVKGSNTISDLGMRMQANRIENLANKMNEAKRARQASLAKQKSAHNPTADPTRTPRDKFHRAVQKGQAFHRRPSGSQQHPRTP